MEPKHKHQATTANIIINASGVQIVGNWDLASQTSIRESLKKMGQPSTKALTIDGSAITAMDTYGALQLQKLMSQLQKNGYVLQLQSFNSQHLRLLDQIKSQAKDLVTVPPLPIDNPLVRLGKRTMVEVEQFLTFLTFVGEITTVALRSLLRPQKIHWRPLMSVIETTGYNALPIIALLSFMIGVVLAYQLGVQLKAYGANIFIVELIGAAVLREFGILLTAIMVVGRTGSAYTAQLGTMKLNEEIDALQIMGIPPNELLILPRIVGLLIVLPLLTIWADIFGVLGGMVMAKGMMDINYYDFLTRFRTQVSLSSLMIGIGKAPVFALLIASTGCFQGMQVTGSAESVGQRTTRSVVQAIFLIIVADSLFSIAFSKFGI